MLHDTLTRIGGPGRVPKVVRLVVIDSALWSIAVPVAAVVRYDFAPGEPSPAGMAVVALLAVILNMVAGFLHGGYRGRWRLGSIDDAVGLATQLASVTLALTAFTALADRPIPVSASFIAGALATGLIGASRLAWRLVIETVAPSAQARRMVVYGAGDTASQAVTTILSDPTGSFRPVALLEDDPAHVRRTIRGIRVAGGKEDLPEVARLHRADVLLIASNRGTSSTIRELTGLAATVGLEVLVVPPPSELFGTLAVQDLRTVSHEDLLGRDPVETDLVAVAGYVTGRTILITGAGGSIGSELCRQVDALGPKKLVLVDRDESALHAVQLSLTGRAMLDDDGLVVADIRDRDRMLDVFERWQPDVVFHAAALKHLPLLEQHPAEGVKTNVYGTLHVLEAAAKVGVDRFVNISTDKAADPTSVLGYTKRIAERLTAHFGSKASGTYLSVRFGNVLGSRGSVLTAFRSQIESGGPVTVTHELVSRYFMTVQEAVQLVVQAGAVGENGQALVLDMGDPVLIRDVAERMIDASGKDIEIEYTGLRPGEKLHEILLGEDEPDERAAHPLISHAHVPALDPLELSLMDDRMHDVDAMIDLCANRARRWHDRLWAEEVAAAETVIDIRTDPAPPVRIKLARPDLGEEEIDAIRRVFESGQLTNGPETAAFEREFAAHHGAAHGVAVANGTIGLQAVLQALGVGPGDEVIVPSLTFISSATSVSHVGATPVFAEVDARTFNLDVAHVESQITGRTKAVMAVHYAGQAADLEALSRLCAARGLELIEDAAEAHGATYQGRHVGTFGRAAMFSFTPTKNITTGEGGMILTDDGELAAQLRLLRNHAQTARYEHAFIGYNWRMTEMQAAIGRVQVTKLESILARKRANAAWMSHRLASTPGVTPPYTAADRDHVFMLYTVSVDAHRNEFLTDLAEAGIEARLYFPPAHLQQAFGGTRGDLPVTEYVSEHVFSIPMHPSLTSGELEEIASTIERTARRVRGEVPGSNQTADLR